MKMRPTLLATISICVRLLDAGDAHSDEVQFRGGASSQFVLLGCWLKETAQHLSRNDHGRPLGTRPNQNN